MPHSKATNRSKIKKRIKKKGKMSLGPSNCDGTKNIEWKNIMDKAEISIKVGNLCEYKCNVCGKCYKSKQALSNHFMKTNHVQHEENLNLECYLVKAVLHKCQLCSKKIICERVPLLSHLLYCHKINTFKEYILMTKAQEEKQGIIRINLKKEVEQILKTETKDFEITEGFDSHCTFACNVCHKTFKNWRALKYHVASKNHGKITSFSQFLKLIFLHKCKVCLEVIFCDQQIISSHLKTHKLTMKSYKEKKFKANIKEDYAKQYMLKINFLTKDIPVINNLQVSVSGVASLSDEKVTRNTGNIC